MLAYCIPDADLKGKFCKTEMGLEYPSSTLGVDRVGTPLIVPRLMNGR